MTSKLKALVLGKGSSGEAAAEQLTATGYSVEFAEGYDLVVASPGLKVISELQYGVELLRARGVKLLAVTGSKGKSSVVKVVTEAIKLSGQTAGACGNYGLPVSAVRDVDWAVVEVSSFQLETTTLAHDTFEAAAILNLQADHLDRHHNLEVYHSLKRKLLSFAKVGYTGGELRIADSSLWRGSYFDNAILGGNAAVAVALMKVAGLNDEVIKSAFAQFEPLPHRMNLVGVFNGIKYIDDSKATSIAALIAGVEMAGDNVRLIAGGLAKGDDPKNAVGVLTNRVKKVYLIGDSAELFATAWAKVVNCEIVHTLDKAVAKAWEEAVSGEKVLLSPGAASFDQFKNFGQRGETFAALVKKEGMKK